MLAAERGLVSGGGKPLCFVTPPEDGLNYELRIRDRGQVATREGNAHDLFNAQTWLDFPLTKAALNRLHCGELQMQQYARRSPVRDALTLFDESGMIVLCAEPALAQLLRSFQWEKLFWERRIEISRAMRFLVFGHALQEKLLVPFKGITARALIFDTPFALLEAPVAGQLAWADERAAAWFARSAALISTRTLHPLPVLGIPGWCADNANAGYYDDASQFRPGRLGEGAKMRP